ncbi:hypothetical protein [Litoribacter populi]|uniref:hypothetical protein n=1 Tax=Litoribacter populi TaxID=2598460 RepID=UPI0011814409|nr:hypothetical protein [Litoribacter populi]
MLIIIILGIVVVLILSVFLFKKILDAEKFKIINKKIIILIIIIFVLAVYFIINIFMSDGIKYVYCLSYDKCVTVWKRGNGEKYIILGKYEGKEIPSDNFIYFSILNSTYVDVIFVNGENVLIAIDDNTQVVKKSSNGLIELYSDNKPLFDSLYTYFDGNYRKYKNEVEFISIDIQENYATDKSGKKLGKVKATK